jgi:hypothetical protein
MVKQIASGFLPAPIGRVVRRFARKSQNLKFFTTSASLRILLAACSRAFELCAQRRGREALAMMVDEQGCNPDRVSGLMCIAALNKHGQLADEPDS